MSTTTSDEFLSMRPEEIPSESNAQNNHLKEILV
jgi:hypothetical protein